LSAATSLPLPPELPDFDAAPVAANDAPLRVVAEDGTLHFSDLKKMALSARQYLYGVNNPIKPTTQMLIGTAVHFHLLGPRHGAKPLVIFEGKRRSGKEWDSFFARNGGAEILTAPEWERASYIAEAILVDPVARARLDGARYEVPLSWEESGFRCSTSGVDIISGAALADLKTTASTHPETWERHAFKMFYHCQMAWYRRGARANGIDCSRGLYLLGVETSPPFEVVELELTEKMIDLADRTLSLWLEKLRQCVLSCPEPRAFSDWPGYAAASVPWELRKRQREDEESDEDEDEEAFA